MEILFERIVEQGHAQDRERRIDLFEPGHRQRGGVKLPDPHLAENVGLAARNTARVDSQPEPATGLALPFVAHLAQSLVPDGTLWDHGRQFERGREGGSTREAESGNRDTASQVSF